VSLEGECPFLQYTKDTSYHANALTSDLGVYEYYAQTFDSVHKIHQQLRPIHNIKFSIRCLQTHDISRVVNLKCLQVLVIIDTILTYVRYLFQQPYILQPLSQLVCLKV
jgi:hypothetical protein